MHLLEQYYENTVKHDLCNKFRYKNLKNLPKLSKIVLSFGCKNLNIKQLIISFLALEIIGGKKGNFTKSKKPNVLLKIRKGNIVGCKLTLEKRLIYHFLSKFIIEIMPMLKIPSKIQVSNNNAVSYQVPNVLIFSELEINYYLFHELSNLNVVFLSNTNSSSEFSYLLNCFKFPLIFKN